MKTTKILSLTFVAICLASITYAQQSERKYWLVDAFEVKSDQVSNFETSLKEINRLFGENNYPYSFMGAKGVGFKYYGFREMKNIAEYEPMRQKTSETWSKIDQDIIDNYMQCFKSNRQFIIRDMPRRNYTPEEPRLKWADFKYAIWDVQYVKFGKTREYYQIIDEFMELAKKHNFNDPIIILRGSIGTRDQMHAGVLYGKNAVDMRQQNQKMWASYGEEGKELYQKLLPLLSDRELIEFWIRRDLSYTVEKEVDAQ